MNITLKRLETNDNGIFGALFDENGIQIAVTCEHNFEGIPVIPLSGEFNCIRRVSPHFGFELFCLQDVPGHSFVEIHPGNTQADSEGCILLGETRIGDAINNSRVTFKKFMELQDGVNEIKITVE